MISPTQCRYAEDVNTSFPVEIMQHPGGEGLRDCIQCGTCSAGCPMSVYMDYTPRRIICLTRAGLEKDVLRSFTPWLCASCYECQVLCPKDIKITDVMYALKQEAMAQGVYPKRFPIPVLAREFFRGVERTGRSSEGPLMVRFFLKTNPLGMLRNISIAWRLWRTGRLSLRQERTRDRGTVRTLLQAAKQA